MPRLDLTQRLFWTVDDLLSPSECLGLIQTLEKAGFADAPITTDRGPVMMSEVRNNTRVMLEDAAFARELFTRAKPHVPAEMSGMRAVGANERFRCYRYEPGQRFKAHLDGAFQRDANEWSLLTFMIYLNDGFEGGETRFWDLEQSVKPRTGRALFFQHRLLHEGCEVMRGIKYVARTDVMYRRETNAEPTLKLVR